MPVDEITALTATVTLPWVLKFTWAPAIDASAARLGRRRWILAAQLAMGLALLPLIFVTEPARHRDLLYTALLLHAIAAATQDVAIDSWAIRGVPVAERGALNGAMQVGKFVGRWLFGAGILLILDGIPLGSVAAVLVALLWSATALVVISGDRAPGVAGAQHDAEAGEFLVALHGALRQPRTWLALAFAVVSGAGFEGLGAAAGPLLVDRGLSEAAIGGFYSASLVAMITGALLGGAASDRWGRRRSSAAFLLFIAACVAAVAWQTSGADAVSVVALMVAMYLGYGMFIAASYALFMDLTDPRLGATQFSAYMGATNACEAWAGFAAGSAAARFGYATGLTALAAVSLLGLPLLALLRRADAAGPPEPPPANG